MAGLLLLTGCARTVAVTDPDPPVAERTLCAAVLADLPARVLDQDRRQVAPGELSAAWGSPAITLRCGVDQPAAFTASSPCFEVNGVGWFTEEVSGGYLFTTIGRPAFVEMAVPRAYAPEAGALVDVAVTVSRHDPLRSPCV